MIEDRILAIERAVERIEKICNRIDADLATDRKDIDQLLIRTGTITEQNEKIINLSDRQTKKLGEKVEDAIEKQIETVAEQVNQINEIIGGE